MIILSCRNITREISQPHLQAFSLPSHFLRERPGPTSAQGTRFMRGAQMTIQYLVGNIICSLVARQHVEKKRGIRSNVAASVYLPVRSTVAFGNPRIFVIVMIRRPLIGRKHKDTQSSPKSPASVCKNKRITKPSGDLKLSYQQCTWTRLGFLLLKHFPFRLSRNTCKLLCAF